MKTVKRETDPDIIDRLKSMFIGDGEFTPDFLADELRARIAVNEESVCIIVGYDNNEIVGFLVAVEFPNRHYLWLEQAFNESGYSVMSEHAIHKLMKWAAKTGKKEMRFETSPECPPDYITHRIAEHRGFKKHSDIYALRF